MGYACYGVADGRDGGYGVPSWCDQPDCTAEIDRGLAYCCGGEPGAIIGCGLYFCEHHLGMIDDPDGDGCIQVCERCRVDPEGAPFPMKDDHPDWIAWKLTDDSWAEWRERNAGTVAAMREMPAS